MPSRRTSSNGRALGRGAAPEAHPQSDNNTTTSTPEPARLTTVVPRLLEGGPALESRPRGTPDATGRARRSSMSTRSSRSINGVRSLLSLGVVRLTCPRGVRTGGWSSHFRRTRIGSTLPPGLLPLSLRPPPRRDLGDYDSLWPETIPAGADGGPSTRAQPGDPAMSPIQDDLRQRKICAGEQSDRRRFNWASGTSAVGGAPGTRLSERRDKQQARCWRHQAVPGCRPERVIRRMDSGRRQSTPQ